MRIGDRKQSRDEALALLSGFATEHAGTVLLYDLAGDQDGFPGAGGAAEPVNRVTLADIGRLVVINARLQADDVPLLLSVDADAAFQAVPPAARLENCTPGSSLHEAATCLYGLFKALPNIGRAKRSKLLHIKRPWLIPISDTHVERVYRERVSDLGGSWWEAARLDLIDGSEDFGWLSATLKAHDDACVRRAGKLTELRLLDIITWCLGGSPRHSGTGC